MSGVARLFALLLGTWFVLLRTEPVALHACQMHHAGGHAHGGPAAAVVAIPAATSPVPVEHDHAEHHHGAATHAAVAAEMASSTPDAPEPTDPAGCLCLGACCSAGLSVTVPLPAVSWQAVIVQRGLDHPVEAPVVALRTADAHRLPFANGPPTLG